MTIRTEKISSNNNASKSLSVENQVEGAKKRGGHLLQAPGPIGYPVEYGGLTMLITQPTVSSRFRTTRYQSASRCVLNPFLRYIESGPGKL